MSNVHKLLPKVDQADQVRFTNTLLAFQTMFYFCILGLASWRIRQLKQQVKQLRK